MTPKQNKMIIANELRPCIVNGKKALFHTWTEKEGVILKIMGMVGRKQVEDLLEVYKELGVIPPHFEVVKEKTTFALVEYEDGQIAEVKPTDVRFIDNAHNDYIFTEGSR